MKLKDIHISSNKDLPVNPLTIEVEDGKQVFTGITKREYFAALAMQGYLASNNGQTYQYLAERSVKAADELLKQLENSK